jgi:hypothetical protein
MVFVARKRHGLVGFIAKKGQEPKMSYWDTVVVENPHGLVTQRMATQAFARREAVPAPIPFWTV